VWFGVVEIRKIANIRVSHDIRAQIYLRLKQLVEIIGALEISKIYLLFMSNHLP
jgi:hypothetical protein